MWFKYIGMVEILCKFKAEWTEKYNLHLQAVKDMLPYFAASGHSVNLLCQPMFIFKLCHGWRKHTLMFIRCLPLDIMLSVEVKSFGLGYPHSDWTSFDEKFEEDRWNDSQKVDDWTSKISWATLHPSMCRVKPLHARSHRNKWQSTRQLINIKKQHRQGV